jgi:hypothetical protein
MTQLGCKIAQLEEIATHLHLPPQPIAQLW